MTGTVFYDSRENKFLSCLSALLQPAPAAVGTATVRSGVGWVEGASVVRALRGQGR